MSTRRLTRQLPIRSCLSSLDSLLPRIGSTRLHANERQTEAGRSANSTMGIEDETSKEAKQGLTVNTSQKMPDKTAQQGLRSYRRLNHYINAMQQDMDSIMDAFMPGFGHVSPFRMHQFDGLSPLAALSQVDGPARALAIDVQEKDEEFVLTAATPGFSKDEIKVTLEAGNVLTVRGEHTADHRFESFVRRVSLPDEADTEHISAKAEHGVLTIQIPKELRRQDRTKQITVS